LSPPSAAAAPRAGRSTVPCPLAGWSARRWLLRPFRLESPDLAAIYRPIRRFNEFNKSGLDKLEPDIAELPEWWEQDYIIYERVAQQ
jgi:hypothetical protein